MKLLLIPIICLVLGIGAGVGAGVFLAPEPSAEDTLGEGDAVGEDATEEQDIEEVSPDISGVEYVDMNNQFIVPLLVDGRVDAIIVLAIGLEVIEGEVDGVMSREPKLRAAFLQSLFNHANNGGFLGNFTDYSSMETLRRELMSVARGISDRKVTDVLVLDVVRQNP